MTKRTLTTLFLPAVVLVAIVIGVISVQAQGGINREIQPLPVGAVYEPSSAELSLADVYQQATRSVVNISIVTPRASGTGSGFVIDTDGHIVTNSHVVEDAAYIQVAFVDGTILEAEFIGADPEVDLAVIQVDPAATTLYPVTFVDSDEVFVGQQTLAIGSPFDQDFTLTTGIVSAIDRSLRNDNLFSIPELIQTDAAINPGNSGGPLMDNEGNVIGVNTAILSSTRSASGVGFAIPANTVRRVVPYLIETGEYDHSWLGISGMTVIPAQREAMNLPVDFRGVMVTAVSRQGPAALAGLSGASGVVGTPFGRVEVDGDIITAVNNTPVAQMSDLIAYLEAETLPGDEITLTVWRNGNLVNIEVELRERPE
ncbi:MAG: PDZ domain-containing protein [Chloroflexi bacterium]|nr:PDZ domain-containing protein [Chloroflexota bacterium]